MNKRHLKKRRVFPVFIVVLLVLTMSGCWNYREIDKLTVVAGIAIDKGMNEPFEITAEIIRIEAGKETNIKSQTLSAEGKSLFDAARNIISITGKRLYWSHTKVIIISKYIAEEGVSRILEWYNRDAETREDVHILISQCETAKEIFKGQQSTESILSFSMDEILENEASLSKAPVTDILEYDIESKTIGISPILPAISLKQADSQKIPQIMGAAFIKNDRLAGFLSGEETRDLHFIRDDIKGGVLVVEMQTGSQTSSVALEIFTNNTKVILSTNGTGVEVKLLIKTTAAIDEINGAGDFINGGGLEKLTQKAQDSLKERIEKLIVKMQTQYCADVFGFGAKLREDNINVFKSVGQNWEDTFRNLAVIVEADITIKNSSAFAKPASGGE